MKNITKEYSNGELTIVWEPKKCIHSEVCFKTLPRVYNPKERPWVRPNNASTEDLKDQINRCPSGALSFYINDEKVDDIAEPSIEVRAFENGPLMVKGSLRVINSNGEEELKERSTSFCRCGASKNKPYCDGSHYEINFEG